MDLEREKVLMKIMEKTLVAPEHKRNSLLEEICKGDAQLISEVRLRLEATESAVDFLELPFVETGNALKKIGHFHISHR